MLPKFVFEYILFNINLEVKLTSVAKQESKRFLFKTK